MVLGLPAWCDGSAAPFTRTFTQRRNVFDALRLLTRFLSFERRSRDAASGPFVGAGRPELRGQRILAREQSVRQRQLPALADTELPAEGIALRLDRSRGDPELRAHLGVGEAQRDELDQPALAFGD